jgi:hypothetical protein
MGFPLEQGSSFDSGFRSRDVCCDEAAEQLVPEVEDQNARHQTCGSRPACHPSSTSDCFTGRARGGGARFHCDRHGGGGGGAEARGVRAVQC